jgi:hypothetical protein
LLSRPSDTKGESKYFGSTARSDGDLGDRQGRTSIEDLQIQSIPGPKTSPSPVITSAGIFSEIETAEHYAG